MTAPCRFTTADHNIPVAYIIYFMVDIANHKETQECLLVMNDPVNKESLAGRSPAAHRIIGETVCA